MREVQLKSSEKLKIIQAMSGVTQEFLAQRFGVSFVTLNSWINGRSVPRKGKVAEIDECYCEFTGQNVIAEEKLYEYYEKLIARRDKILLFYHVDSLLKLLMLRQDLLADLILRLTYSSNKIEGSTLTLPEVREVLVNGVLPVDKSVVEVLEAKNHQQALKVMLISLSDLKFSVDLDFICKLHKLLMYGIWDNPGVWRRHPVRILCSNVVTANWVKIPELMRDFEVRLRDWGNLAGYEAVVEAYALHAVFEKIHPFPDGNGRVGRILLYAMLLKLNLPPVYIVPEERNFYYMYLAKAQNEAEYSQLLKFLFLSTINTFDFFE